MALDIKVGAPDPVARSGAGDGPGTTKTGLEARVLTVRRARRGPRPGTPAGRRRSQQLRDPLGACVITLLVPEGSRLPGDLAKGGYRALLRFVRK